MTIKITVPLWIPRIWWLIADKCLECGGELDEGHITGDRECKSCKSVERA